MNHVCVACGVKLMNYCRIRGVRLIGDIYHCADYMSRGSTEEGTTDTTQSHVTTNGKPRDVIQ